MKVQVSQGRPSRGMCWSGAGGQERRGGAKGKMRHREEGEEEEQAKEAVGKRRGEKEKEGRKKGRPGRPLPLGAHAEPGESSLHPREQERPHGHVSCEQGSDTSKRAGVAMQELQDHV